MGVILEVILKLKGGVKKGVKKWGVDTKSDTFVYIFCSENARNPQETPHPGVFGGCRQQNTSCSNFPEKRRNSGVFPRLPPQNRGGGGGRGGLGSLSPPKGGEGRPGKPLPPLKGGEGGPETGVPPLGTGHQSGYHPLKGVTGMKDPPKRGSDNPRILGFHPITLVAHQLLAVRGTLYPLAVDYSLVNMPQASCWISTTPPSIYALRISRGWADHFLR
jgi:hypothetical protein